MTEPNDSPVRRAFEAAAAPSTRRGADAVVAAARRQAEGPDLVIPTPIGAARHAGRRPLLLAAAAAVVLVLAGAAVVTRRPSSSVSTRSPQELLEYLQQSTGKTLDVHTFTIRQQTTLTGTDLSHISLFGCAPGSPSDSTDDTLAIDLDTRVVAVLDARTGEPRQINAGKTQYYSRNLLPAGVTAPAPWIRVDTDDPLSFMASAAFAGTVNRYSADGFDPAAILEQIQGGASTVTDLGYEDVAGVRSQHLKVVADAERVRQVVNEQRRRRSSGESVPPGTAPGGSVPPAVAPAQASMTFETWVDGDGYLRRVRYEQELPVPAESGSVATAHITATLDLSAFNEVTVAKVPAPGETMAVGDLPAAVLARDPKMGGCPREIPADVPAEVADQMRSYDACAAQAREKRFTGRTVREVQNEVLPVSNCPKPAVEAWCRAELQRGPSGAALRPGGWCSMFGFESISGQAAPADFDKTSGLAPPAPPMAVPADGHELTDAELVPIRTMFKGRSEAQAIAGLQTGGWMVRVIKRDGEDLGVTEDLRRDRLNVQVDHGTVTDVLGNY